jgi:hypothetical protein
MSTLRDVVRGNEQTAGEYLARDPYRFTRCPDPAKIPDGLIAAEYARANKLGVSWIVGMKRYGFRDHVMDKQIIESIHGFTNYRALYRGMKEYIAATPNRGSVRLTFEDRLSTLPDDHRKIVDAAIIEAIRQERLNQRAFVVDMRSVFGIGFFRHGCPFSFVLAASQEEAAAVVNKQMREIAQVGNLCLPEHCEPLDSTKPQAYIILG